jgi:hypothetical protein
MSRKARPLAREKSGEGDEDTVQTTDHLSAGNPGWYLQRIAWKRAVQPVSSEKSAT